MILENNMLKKIEKMKDKVARARVERNNYLGEYKERVIVALTKSELSEKNIYPEVKKAVMKKIASQMIISRDTDLSKIKKYIRLSQEMKLPCKMVDGLSYVGDIGLVVVSKEALKNPKDDPVPLSFEERILNSGLDEIFYKSMGKKISKKYYDIIKEKLPELLAYYKPITFLDRITGTKCPIVEKLEN